MNQIASIFFAFMVALCFAIALNCPKKHLMAAGITGAMGWIAYSIGLIFHTSVLASFYGACAIGLSSHIFARIMKAPVIIFLIPGILVLVPGADLYRSVYQTFLGSRDQAAFFMNQTLRISGMIAIGVFTVDSVFQVINRFLNQRLARKNN